MLDELWLTKSLQCSEIGRLPSLKIPEVNIRLPDNENIAIIRAGPGGVRSLSLHGKNDGHLCCRVNQELHGNAIKSITDMLTFAKVIDDWALVTTIFINHSFFHAACAYSRDILHGQTKGKITISKDLSPSAFPIPSQTLPMVFQLDQISRHHTASNYATESAYSSSHPLQRPTTIPETSHHGASPDLC